MWYVGALYWLQGLLFLVLWVKRHLKSPGVRHFKTVKYETSLGLMYILYPTQKIKSNKLMHKYDHVHIVSISVISDLIDF